MKVVIVGGVAGGASCAARLRRLDERAEIVLVERGEFVSFANCGLPYHISGVIPEEDDLLVQTVEGLKRRFNIDVRVRTEALSVDAGARSVQLKDLDTGRAYTENYDTLVLAPGAEPIRPDMPGLGSPRVYTLRNIPDMNRIIGAARGAKRAVVIGAGYIGVETAENLADAGLDVEVVELADHIIGPLDAEMAALLIPAFEERGVGLTLCDGIAAVREKVNGVVAVLTSGREIAADFAVLGIGVRPETKLAESAGVRLGVTGGIWVDAGMRTSDPAIYAVGDAIEVEDFMSGEPARIPLAGPANRQGRIAADNIAGRNSEYRKTLGAAVVKVFDRAAAMAGSNERQLKARGAQYDKVYTHSGSHAGYYPGAKPLSLKLLYEKPSGKILGAQAVGMEGADKRMDVLATAMRAGLTVFDLEHLELCYAPPFSSAKDPVNVAGFVAANVLKGDMPVFHWHDISGRDQEKTQLLDVRTPTEYRAGTIEDARNIPVDDLRKRMGELPRDKEILVFCQVGLRAHIATRILLQNGFNAKNMTGGYKTWKTATTCAR
jgi:NADPH-dependent 2,4-dienoyl-CoA reductase/sulfur reductase-like enzyme/rhodanese-related sulfurtransferase